MRRFSSKILIFSACLAVFSSEGASLAAGGGGGGSSGGAPFLLVGMNSYGGASGKSLNGATGYGLTFGMEATKGVFRTLGAARFEYSKDTATLGDASTGYSMYGASFVVGGNVVMFPGSRFQPYLMLGGIGGVRLMNVTSSYTQSFSYGYELGAGVDIPLGNGGKGLRIRGTTSTVTAISELAGQTGFQFNSYIWSLGLSY